MLKIRFQRVGRRNDPAFRIVVTEHQARTKTNGLETLGSHHPKTKSTLLKNERIIHWLSKGAKATDSVHNLLISKGVIKGSKIHVTKGVVASQSPVSEDPTVVPEAPEAAA